VTLINQNNSIDTIYELFLILAIFLFVMVFICKIGTFFESLPVREKKTKKSNVKEIKKEEKVVVNNTKEVVVDKEVHKVESNTSSSCSNGGCCPLANAGVPIIIQQSNNDNNTQSNYLYDRFVDRPSNEDNIETKQISESFMSENEYNTIINSQVNIKVNDNSYSEKSKLYNRINQMTSNNAETREKLLQEFEGLSKEMKLLLIDNIIRKM